MKKNTVIVLMYWIIRRVDTRYLQCKWCDRLSNVFNCWHISRSAHPTRPTQSPHSTSFITAYDPLQGVKIPRFGDELTQVRLAGARDLRSGCHTAKQRLDHLYPYRIVGWHTKRSFLKVILVSVY